MKKLLIIFIYLLMFNPAAWAEDDLKTAQELLKKSIGTVFSVLQAKDLPAETRNKKIVGAIEPIFDHGLMAKLALGKKYWLELSKNDRKKFVELFNERLKESYLEKFNLYTDEKVTYGAPFKVKNKIHIPTTVLSKDTKLSMVYKFYQTREKNWMVYDLEIQDVSFIQAYRSQFDQILKNGSVNDLLVKMEKREKK